MTNANATTAAYLLIDTDDNLIVAVGDSEAAALHATPYLPSDCLDDAESWESVVEYAEAHADALSDLVDGYTVVRVETLDDLFRALIEHDAADRVVTSLPTFGGEDVEDTTSPVPVWSWDAERMIVGHCSEDFQIVPRTEA